jgi:indole-3-glycerol phosphate synthase
VLSAFDIIAEVKLHSPAVGALGSEAFDLKRQVEAYARGGACAVSVLTEPTEFKGSLEHLRAAAAHLTPLRCPVMRKDFLTEPYQVLEARVAGASGVLLIATMLDDQQLGVLLDCAREQDLFVLVEAFDRDDLARIARLPLSGFPQPVLVGLNCRDLKSLKVDFSRFAELAPSLPSGLPAVAESGVQSTADVASIVDLGFRLALVGSALMRAGDAAVTLAQFIATGRTRTEAM